MQSYSLYIHIHNPFPCPSRLPHRSTSNPFLNYFFLHFLMYTLLRLISLVYYNSISIVSSEKKILISLYAGINILCGIGLLTTPYAIKEGGWLSLIFLVIFAVFCCYTGVLLKECLESSPGLKTYPDIGQAAFGLAGRLGIAVSPI